MCANLPHNAVGKVQRSALKRTAAAAVMQPRQLARKETMMTTTAQRDSYTVRVGVTNISATFRQVSLPGLRQPVTMGFHPGVADVYGVPAGSYETTAPT